MPGEEVASRRKQTSVVSFIIDILFNQSIKQGWCFFFKYYEEKQHL